MHDPIFDIFRDEAREHLRSLEKGFLELEKLTERSAREQLVDSLFRHAHNMKGDSRALDLRDVQQAAAVLEETLEAYRQGPDAVDTAAINRGLQELDTLLNAFESWYSQAFPVAPIHETEVVENVEAAPATEAAGLGASESVAASSPVKSQLAVRISSDVLDRMLDQVGEVRLVQRADNALEDQLKDLRSRLDEITHLLPAEHRPAMDATVDHVRRIETSLHRQHSRQQVLMQLLEEDIRSARLLPLSMLADSLRRPIRDLAQSLGKNVDYVVETGNVMLDKAVIESLRTPLLHLIRNAIDHGIESPAVRAEKGKPTEGKIKLTARRRGKKVSIQVVDDGAGPDFEKIRKRLVTRNILAEEDVLQLTEEQLGSWLFQPGFSTAAPGEISGRGVGLDVVRDALQRIQGKIDLKSVPNEGTTFSLMLPVTISTIRVLTVWCGAQCFGLPSESISSTGRVKMSQVRDLKGTSVISIGGESIRWVSLADVLHTQKTPCNLMDAYQHYVVIRQENHSVALHVDDLDDEREVLLKQLGYPLSGMQGILGGTIRPDGSVQLVLDIGLDLFLEAEAVATSAALSAPVRTSRILVVDDSPTTRAMLRSVFTAAGYQVQTAVDGVDAQEKLRTQRPDLVVCDFEMPRMNGVELTRHIKAKWHLPVILVTGREQEHHRREGLEAGADAYLVKSSFRGEGLMDVVRQFVGQE